MSEAREQAMVAADGDVPVDNESSLPQENQVDAGEGGSLAPTPGQQLRAAREARGMSVRDVADILRFSPRQVELLEGDAYDQLPGNTLVRGFVRGYAKLLKLDAAPLLAALTPDVPPVVPEVRPPQNMGVAEETEASAAANRSALPWGSIAAGLVLLAAIGLVVYLVRSAPGSNTAAVEAPKTAAPTAVTPAATTEVAPPAPRTLAGESAAAAAPANENLMPPTSALVLEFDGLSWIEVRDATQKVVFVGEYPKGTRQLVGGQAPFQLWVGKASVVRVTFGERSIDLKPHTREDVARLTVE